MFSKILCTVVAVLQVVVVSGNWTRHLTEEVYFNSSREARRFGLFGSSNDNDASQRCGSGAETGVCTATCKAAKGGRTVGGGAGGGGNTCTNGQTCCQYSARCPTDRQEPCIIKISGTSVVNENNANSMPYFRTYRYQRPKGMCQLRLDFDVFQMDPADTAGNCNRDSLAAPGLSICGFNTGQHAYFRFEDSNFIDVSVNIQNTASIYNIRSTFIKCGSNREAPPDCLQFFTARDSTVLSFGFGRQLNNLDYTACIRRARGMNRIRWTECPDDRIPMVPNLPNVPSPVDPFFISGIGIDSNLPQGVACPRDWVQPNGLFRYCGTDFPNVISTGRPFTLNVHFDDIEGPGVALPQQPADCTGQDIPDPANGGAWRCIPNGAPPTTCDCRFIPTLPINPPPGFVIPTPDGGNTGFCLRYTQLP